MLKPLVFVGQPLVLIGGASDVSILAF